MIAGKSTAKTEWTRLELVGQWKRPLALFSLLLGMGLAAPWAVADKDKISHADLQEVAPLRSLLAQIHQTYPGQILEVELEKGEYGGEDILTYEVKLLTDEGRVLKLEYGANNLELLKIKGHPDK